MSPSHHDEGSFLYHAPCESCGSSDGKAIYSTGTAFCFVCETYFREVDDVGSASGEGRKRMAESGLLTDITYKSLEKRNISEETCRKFGYGYSFHNRQRVQVAPYYHNGTLVAQHLRTASKEFSWLGSTKKLELFGQHLWRNGGKRVVVTEGEIDCLSVAQVFNLKWPVVSVPNGAQSAKKYIQKNIEFLEAFDEVVIAFDNDDEGRKAAEECALILTPGKVKLANWSPYKDANEILQAKKPDLIAGCIFNAKQYRPDGIIAGSDLTLEYLISNEELKAYSIPFPQFNEKLRGIRKAEITTFTAGSGVGKSTLAREIAYHLAMEHDLKIGYVALEESVKKSAIGMIALNLNVPMGDLFLDKSLVPASEFERAYREVIASDRFYFYDHFGSLESENLVSKLRFLATGLGVDFIVLDHISIVVSGIEDGDERRIIDNLMTSLRALVENTGVGMLLISHLSKPQGKPHEEGGRVTLSDLRGSQSIKQLSDNIVALERDQQGEDSDLSLIRILKNRLFGDLGPADYVRYHRDTGRLLPDEKVDNDDAGDFLGIEEVGGKEDAPF